MIHSATTAGLRVGKYTLRICVRLRRLGSAKVKPVVCRFDTSEEVEDKSAHSFYLLQKYRRKRIQPLHSSGSLKPKTNIRPCISVRILSKRHSSLYLFILKKFFPSRWCPAETSELADIWRGKGRICSIALCPRRRLLPLEIVERKCKAEESVSNTERRVHSSISSSPERYWLL